MDSKRKLELQQSLKDFDFSDYLKGFWVSQHGYVYSSYSNTLTEGMKELLRDAFDFEGLLLPAIPKRDKFRSEATVEVSIDQREDRIKVIEWMVKEYTLTRRSMICYFETGVSGDEWIKWRYI